jgi:hypothetical protein
VSLSGGGGGPAVSVCCLDPPSATLTLCCCCRAPTPYSPPRAPAHVCGARRLLLLADGARPPAGDGRPCARRAVCLLWRRRERVGARAADAALLGRGHAGLQPSPGAGLGACVFRVCVCVDLGGGCYVALRWACWPSSGVRLDACCMGSSRRCRVQLRVQLRIETGRRQRSLVSAPQTPPSHTLTHLTQGLHFIQIIRGGCFSLFDYGSPAANMGE